MASFTQIRAAKMTRKLPKRKKKKRSMYTRKVESGRISDNMGALGETKRIVRISDMGG